MMYLAQYSIEEISGKLNLNINDLKLWVFGKDGKGDSPSCWNVVRSQVSDTSIAAYVMEKQLVFDRTTGIALSCLTRSLERLNTRISDGEELDVDQIHKLSNVVMNMDKIGRLESGKATQIIHNTGLTPEKIREIIQNDPISDGEVIDATFVELDDV